MTDALAVRQLSALARLGEVLDREGIAYWLFGGWAVDFHLGTVTRRHDDLDVAVWLAEHERIDGLLRSEGWRHAPVAGEDGGTGYERGGVRLELTFLVRDDDGRVHTPLRTGRGDWPRGAFGSDVGELASVRFRVVSRASLVRAKSTPRDDPNEAAKDRADLDRLTRL